MSVPVRPLREIQALWSQALHKRWSNAAITMLANEGKYVRWEKKKKNERIPMCIWTKSSEIARRDFFLPERVRVR